MIDIAILRANPEAVKENMIKKFQHSKLPLVDEILLVDKQCREFVTKGSELRGRKNELSKQIGFFFKNKEIDKIEIRFFRQTKRVKRNNFARGG